MLEVNLKESWEEVRAFFSKTFVDQEEELDIDSIIYLIGVQELGKGFVKFKKDDKVNLMHIAICRLLEPYGFYEFDFYDNEGWPHYIAKEDLPTLKPGEQSILMKEAIVKYYFEQGLSEKD